jgi:D-inositol-3-phosphate glycosyltransferase
VKKEQLRIAMISIHSNPIGELGTKDTGGMSVYIREIAREIGRCGHLIDIYTRLQNSVYQPVIQLFDNVRLIHLGISNNGNLSKLALFSYLSDFFKSLEKFRRREGLQYDLIHSHYWLSGRLGIWAQKLWNRPHVLMLHTIGKEKNRTGVGIREPEIRITTEKKIVETCHRILAPTNREKESLIRFYGAPAYKIGVVPCGVDLSLFHPLEKKTARNQLGFDADEVILLYVGRFEPLKGLDRLLDTISYLKHHPRLRLVIVGGDGDETTESQFLKQKTKALGIRNKVIFAGRVEQKKLPPYYGSADVLVVPSYYESFCLVGLEALACGRPVVSTPVGAMENLIRESRAGHVVKDYSPQSMAMGIESIINNFLVPPADKIRESVLSYCWSNVAMNVLEQYESLLIQHSFEDDRLVSVEASY